MSELGRSLPVPNVQALAAAATQVPDRYLRPEAEADLVADRTESSKLPIIDLGLLLMDDDSQLCGDEHAKLELACRGWGFFQLINHGVPAELIQKVKEDATEFFELPLLEKEAFAQSPDGGLDGYGHAFVASEEQKLDWVDSLVLFAQPVATRNMRFWPTNPPTFRNTMNNYSQALNELLISMLRSISKNLGLDAGCLPKTFEDNYQAVGINYYPACRNANRVLGISPHSDGDGLTILFQINNVPGLQIKKNGMWFNVEPLEDAFIVNIGDLLEILSNGRYKSIEHRAIINAQKERISVAAFHSPNISSIVGPLPELLKREEKKYKSTSHSDYLRAYFAAKLAGKSHLERMKIEEMKQTL